MMKRSFVVIGLAAASLWATQVHAHGKGDASCNGGGPHMGHHGKMGGGPARVIGLIFRSADPTQDQKDQIHKILEADRPAVHDLGSQLRQANDALANTLLAAGGVQTDTVTTQLAQINQLHQQLAQHGANALQAVRGVLTADQLAKVAAALQQIQQQHATNAAGNAD
jgi:Spy/CpxP family protein refolding chaperone